MKAIIQKRWLHLPLFSLCFIFVAAALFAAPGGFRLHPEDIVRLYPDSDFQAIGLEASGNGLTSTADDSRMIFSFAPSRIRSVTVLFERPLRQKTAVQVFYASEGEAFSEGNSVRAVALAVGGLILLSMLLLWTSDASAVILGVQGRYFIPILPLVFLTVNGDSLMLKRSVDPALMMTGSLLNIAAIALIVRYTLLNA